MGKLSNKVAVVTGGNSGIGFETAKKFISEGARVLITGRNEEKLKKASAEIGAEYFVADASDSSDITKLAEHLKENYQGIDILFNNAGVFFMSPLGSINKESIDSQMDINFKGAVLTTDALLPEIKENGSIINLSSVIAYMGTPGTAIYAASKAALNSFTRTAAAELAPKKIRVNSINPGPIETPIFEKTGMSEEQISGFAETIQQKIPLQRFGKTKEVADFALFLASDESSYMTGGEYNVDGGATLIS